MPFKSICLLCLAFISLLYSQTAGAAGDAIVWAKNPSPPFHIMNGKLKGYGICDVMTDKLDVLLADLDTSVEIYPHPRVNKYVGEAENLCFPCMIKREDSGTYTYSNTTMRYPALGVIIHRSFLTKLELSENTPVSFAKLMSIHTLAFGLPSARKYPDALQSILNKQIGQPHILEIAGTEGPLRVLRQIARGRLDYTIDYPSVLKYFSMTEHDDSLVFLPVTEMGDTLVEGAIGCTNNPWGKRAVGHINGVLKRLQQDPEFKENQAFWLNVIEQLSSFCLLVRRGVLNDCCSVSAQNNTKQRFSNRSYPEEKYWLGALLPQVKIILATFRLKLTEKPSNDSLKLL